MATTTTTVSAWGKPGAWALDSEAHEEELLHQPNTTAAATTATATATSDFPSLSAAAATATKSKKKKSQTLSLSEFATGKSVTHGSAKLAFQSNSGPKGLTHDELLVLPTGPRERSADELERSSSRLGGGFRSYGSMDNGGGGAGRSGGRYSSFSNGGDDSSNGRWGSSSSSSSSRVSEDSRRNLGFNNNNNNREFAPSRADEIDDWGAAKKSVAPPAPYERRERSNGGGGFFESHSRADESDSWLTKKSFAPSEPRRYGFENNRDRRGGFEGFQKEGSDGGEADPETWLKKKEEGIGGGNGSGGGRPRLVLQPRTLPVSNGGGEQQQLGSSSATKSKSSNPFGAARPREEVLAEKGQDWKKIDEQLESMKIKENVSGGSGDGSASHWKKSFGSGNGRGSLPDGRAERSWKKTESADAGPPQSDETSSNKDEGMVEDVVEN